MPRSTTPRRAALLALGAIAMLAACRERDATTDPCIPFPAGSIAYLPAIDLLVRDVRGQGLALGDTAVTYVGADSVITIGFDTLHLRAGPAAPGTYSVRVKRKFYRDAVVPNVVVASGGCGGPMPTVVPVSLALVPGAPPIRSVAVFGAGFLYAPGLQRQLVAQVDADPSVPLTVSWRLSDTTVARIDAAGLLTGKCTVAAGVVDTVTAVVAADTSMKGRAAFGVARQTACP